MDTTYTSLLRTLQGNRKKSTRLFYRHTTYIVQCMYNVLYYITIYYIILYKVDNEQFNNPEIRFPQNALYILLYEAAKRCGCTKRPKYIAGVHGKSKVISMTKV